MFNGFHKTNRKSHMPGSIGGTIGCPGPALPYEPILGDRIWHAKKNSGEIKRTD